MSRADLRKLAAILTQERAALLRGDLPRLEQLAARKLTLLDRLEASPLLQEPQDSSPEGALVQQIQALARRNAPLFEAAIAGIREARALLARARETGRAQTYGRDGARARLDPPTGSLHRRA